MSYINCFDAQMAALEVRWLGIGEFLKLALKLFQLKTGNLR